MHLSTAAFASEKLGSAAARRPDWFLDRRLEERRGLQHSGTVAMQGLRFERVQAMRRDVCEALAELGLPALLDVVDFSGRWEVNARDTHGNTLLYACAIITTHVESVRELLSRGANPHVACHGRHLALELMRVHFGEEHWRREAAAAAVSDDHHRSDPSAFTTRLLAQLEKEEEKMKKDLLRRSSHKQLHPVSPTAAATATGTSRNTSPVASRASSARQSLRSRATSYSMGLGTSGEGARGRRGAGTTEPERVPDETNIRIWPPLLRQLELCDRVGGNASAALECLLVLVKDGSMRLPPLREMAAATSGRFCSAGELVPLERLRAWTSRMFLRSLHGSPPGVVALCARFKSLDPDLPEPGTGRRPLHWATLTADSDTVSVLLRACADPSHRDPITRVRPIATACVATDPRHRASMIQSFVDDDARRVRASEDPWRASEACADVRFWTDMLLAPGEVRPHASRAPRANVLEPFFLDADEDTRPTSRHARSAESLPSSVGAIEESASAWGRLAHQVVQAQHSSDSTAADDDDDVVERPLILYMLDLDCRGFAPLHAAAVGTASLVIAFEDPSVELLLAAGADPCACDARGRTAADVMREQMQRMRAQAPGRPHAASEWGWHIFAKLRAAQDAALTRS